MDLIKAVPLLLTFSLVGCFNRNDPWSTWRTDSPEVRKMQEAENVKHVSPEDSERLKKSIGKYVAIIYQNPEDGVVHTFPPRTENGRAVAITSNGYYLTAFHVVGDKPFSLYESRIKKDAGRGTGRTSGQGYRLEQKTYPGRLVWRDPDLDLALVKFSRNDVPHIRKMRLGGGEGEPVYTADDEGWTALPPVGHVDMSQRVGNGSFFAAGNMESPEILGKSPQSIGQLSTVISRGAMSGAPLVTARNEICGIIGGARIHQRSLFSRSNPKFRTYSSMVDPDFIKDKIREDRRKTRKRS